MLGFFPNIKKEGTNLCRLNSPLLDISLKAPKQNNLDDKSACCCKPQLGFISAKEYQTGLFSFVLLVMIEI
jgi:hypothetical protein